MKTKTLEHELLTPLKTSKVTEDGFADVSIMSIGEAAGHAMIVDDKTISQFMRLALGKSFSSYLSHRGAVDENGRVIDRLGEEVGVFSGFYRDGNSVRARQFQFLKSFRTDHPAVYNRLIELAQNFADQLGISPVVGYVLAKVAPDGTERVVERNDGEQPTAMRIRDIISLDFVKSPATNTGLFQTHIQIQPTENMTEEEKARLLQLEQRIDAQDAEISTLKAAVQEIKTALEDDPKKKEEKTEPKESAAGDQGTLPTELAKLNAAISTLAAQVKDAAQYDMRKAGASEIRFLSKSMDDGLPAPQEGTAAKWAQYAALCETEKDAYGRVLSHKETEKAKAFHAKYLSITSKI